MKKAIEELNNKYGTDITIERCRYDVYDHRGGYFTRIWDVVNGTTVCVIKHKTSDINKILEELENKIKEAKGL